MIHRIPLSKKAIYQLICLVYLGLTGSMHAKDGRMQVIPTQPTEKQGLKLVVAGDNDEDWLIEFSDDLQHWQQDHPPKALISGNEQGPFIQVSESDAQARFFRAIPTEGLHDTRLLRQLELNFDATNWQTLLTQGRDTGNNTSCTLIMANGAQFASVGARYKGNSSFSIGGLKKSINLELDFSDPEARLMGYKTLNLNNAAADETILREVLYFNAMSTYVPCPRGNLAQVFINGQNWGVYSLIQQENNDLVKEWFPSTSGDRWKAPNVGGGMGQRPLQRLPPGGGGFPPGGGGFPPGGGGGGGGMFASDLSAFSYQGPDVSSYLSYYELKTDNATNAWERLVHAIDVLNNTPETDLREKVEEVFAVDRWLWFLAIENIFTDDDSYWNKGADYGFYFEPESGRIHPIQHDGNEAFVVGDVELSPLEGMDGTNRPLLFKLLPNQELRQRYLAHMRTVLKEQLHPEIMHARIDRLSALSRDAISSDPKKGYTMATYDRDLAALKTFVTERYAFLTNHPALTPAQPVLSHVGLGGIAPGPREGALIQVQVEAGDDQGLDSVWLYWRDPNYGRFAVTQMWDDGAHEDGQAHDGLFAARTSPFPSGQKIHYYVEARAGNEDRAAAFAPARAELEPFSYRVALELANTPSTILIHELMASNQSTLSDASGAYSDWIELYNPTETPQDLSGYHLSDNPNQPDKWTFPEGTVIESGAYLLVWADGGNDNQTGLHASFKLDKDGESLFLLDRKDRQMTVLDQVDYPSQEADVAWGRHPDDLLQWRAMPPTPGAANANP